MYLIDHISDEQLNEYLDHEGNDRLRIEAHLSSCADCARRLSALQALFDEIESLPELPLSNEIVVSVTRSPGLPARLPRSLRLTVTLQAALAVVTIILTAPFVMPFLAPYASRVPAPSFIDFLLPLQSQWTAWLDLLSTLSLPKFPEMPAVNVSSLVLMFTVLGASLLWLIGNGLLLRDQIKPRA
jgi:hypothetical protein